MSLVCHSDVGAMSLKSHTDVTMSQGCHFSNEAVRRQVRPLRCRSLYVGAGCPAFCSTTLPTPSRLTLLRSLCTERSSLHHVRRPTAPRARQTQTAGSCRHAATARGVGITQRRNAPAPPARRSGGGRQTTPDPVAAAFAERRAALARCPFRYW